MYLTDLPPESIQTGLEKQNKRESPKQSIESIGRYEKKQDTEDDDSLYSIFGKGGLLQMKPEEEYTFGEEFGIEFEKE